MRDDIGIELFGKRRDALEGITAEFVTDADIAAALQLPSASEESARETAELLADLVSFIRRFVVLSRSQLVAVATFVAYTQVMDAFEVAPYIQVTSAEKRCGKSRLLEVLDLLVNRSWLTSRTSAAALVRKLAEVRHTLLLDESDAAFSGDKEYSEVLRGVLNAGHRIRGKVSLCVGKGADLKVRDFSVFGPKVIAGIGRLPDTVADRAVPIALQRKLPGEECERFRHRLVAPEASRLRARLEQWGTEERVAELHRAEPSLPEVLSDRQQDVSEPLLAVADVAGGDWPISARTALVELFGASAGEDTSTGVRLLSDIRDVFTSIDDDHIASKELASQLTDIEGAPWAEWNHGKGLTASTLARQLRKFEIAPRTIRLGTETSKGYMKEWFTDAWSRYLAPAGAGSGFPTVTPSQPAKTLIETPISNRHTDVPVTVVKSGFHPHKQRLVTDVTVQNPENATKRQKRAISGEV